MSELQPISEQRGERDGRQAAMFELRHLRAFVAVAEGLHFGRAAEQLHLTQSSLSAQIAQLETQLGVRLFQRTTRQVSLTRAGELMLPRARRALSGFRAAERLGEELRAGQLGTLSIGSTPRARTTAGPLLQAFALAHEHVMLNHREATTAVLFQGLQRNDLDLAICFEAGDAPGYSRETIRRQSWCVALPADHRLAASPSLRLTNLDETPIVFETRGVTSHCDALALTLCRQAGFEPHRASITLGWDEDFAPVAAGHGARLIPEGMTQDRTIPGVSIRRLDDELYASIELVWASSASTPLIDAILGTATTIGHRRGWLDPPRIMQPRPNRTA